MDYKLLEENKFDMDEEGDMEEVITRLRNAHGNKVYANILASHGGVSMVPSRASIPRLPDSVRLFLIATRGYQHQQGKRDTEEKHAIKYLKVLREGVEEEMSSGTSFYDDDGCLTVLGEKTLANMMLVMGGQQTYKEYYGAEFPNIAHGWDDTWYTYRKKRRYNDGKEWEWSAPFLLLKIYNDRYNEQNFTIDTGDRQERFGVLFQYREKSGEIKNIYLHINIEIGNILLSQIFQELKPLFDRLGGTQFNFTHMSCRSDRSVVMGRRALIPTPAPAPGETFVSHIPPDPPLTFITPPGAIAGKILVLRPHNTLTKEFSDRGSELSSKHCFIRKFNEKYREGLEVSLNDFDTIYEFYNKLKEEGKYDTFLDLLDQKEKAKLVAGGGWASTAENKLFRFIIDFIGVPQAVRLAEEKIRAEEAARFYSGWPEDNEEARRQWLEDYGKVFGGGKQIIKRRKSKRKKNKKGGINKTKKSKRRYRK